MRMTCKLPDHAAAVNALLEGFVRVCQVVIEAGLAPPDPLDANVKYKLEPPGEEDWKLPQDVMRDGWGDCEDMAGWRAGGLRATGEDPEARAEVRRTGAHKLHCVVVRSDGRVEDPSHELWQRQPEGRQSVGDNVKTLDHRKGGAQERRPYSAAAARINSYLKTRKTNTQPLKVIDEATGKPIVQDDGTMPKAGWKGTSTSAAQTQATAQALRQAQADEQAQADMDANDPQYADDAYQDPYGYGGGVDPDWQGPSDWVDPRAIEAFEGSGLDYDDNLSPIDQTFDDGGFDAA